MSRFIRKEELCQLIGLSYSTINRSEKKGQFPCRRRLGMNSVGWPLSEVEAWIQQRPVVTSTITKQSGGVSQ